MDLRATSSVRTKPVPTGRKRKIANQEGALNGHLATFHPPDPQRGRIARTPHPGGASPPQLLARRLQLRLRPRRRPVPERLRSIWWVRNLDRELANLARKTARKVAEGKRHGMIRPDLPDRILIELLCGLAQSVINPEVITRLGVSLREAFDTVFRTVFVGIMTAQGRRTYEQSQKIRGH